MQSVYSTLHSSIFCFANAALYVLVLYLVPSHVRILPRDNPTHIKYRLTTVTLATIISLISVSTLPIAVHGVNYWAAIGIQFKDMVSSMFVTVFLMCVFYMGPLTCLIVFGGISMSHEVKRNGTLVPLEIPRSITSIVWSWVDEYSRLHEPIVILRNLVIAPITEELVFRAVMIPSMVLAATASGSAPSQFTTALLSPLWFGVAHLHHFLDRARNSVSFKSNVITTVVQLLYTSIFGFMAALLFLRTGNIFCPIVCHIICNVIGLPDLGFMNRPDGMGSSSEYSCMFAYRYIFLVLHALGLVLFGLLLYPATEYLQQGLPYTALV